MISIIICSRTKEINQKLTYNIEQTIGCDYELIVIDNSENTYSIFEAYNFGIKKSKGNYWCFIHDDILFHSKNWGKVALTIFQKDKNIGLIGVAGAKIKTKIPSAWWDCPEEMRVINIIQHIPKKYKENWNYGFENEDSTEVVVIDGVFMLGRKDNAIEFDERLTGFHNYDLNLCLEYINNGYKIIVTSEILLEHLSMGTLNKSWYNSTIKIHQIYKKNLPVLLSDDISSLALKKIEVNNGIHFLNNIINFGFNRSIIKVWFNLFKIKPMSKFHLKFLKTILKKC